MQTTENLLPCRCCGHPFIDDPDGYDSYAFCPVCGWQDDEYGYEHPASAGGANKVSLDEAKKAYRERLKNAI